MIQSQILSQQNMSQSFDHYDDSSAYPSYDDCDDHGQEEDVEEGEENHAQTIIELQSKLRQAIEYQLLDTFRLGSFDQVSLYYQ
jgi:hypothetical protein